MIKRKFFIRRLVVWAEGKPRLCYLCSSLLLSFQIKTHTSHTRFRYTRDFNLDKNTHLVAASAEGAKYELAFSCPQIKIVTPSWLEVCEKTERRVDEATYIIQPLTTKPQKSSIISDLDRILQYGGAAGCSLFDHSYFLLLGFEQDMQLKVKLGKLIRRAKGTIFWEINKSVTHLIVHDLCDEPLR